MRKYFTVFKTSWTNELAYRANFFLGRFRSLVFLILLYYVFYHLSLGSGRFAGYQTQEILTYVFTVHLLRALIFGNQSRAMALEINDGTFSAYLVRPINYFWYVFFRELAVRVMYFACALIELAVFSYFAKAAFIFLQSWKNFSLFCLTGAIAMFLYFLLSYLVSLLAFWSREAMGPRFLFEWFLEFSSGAFFPLDILSKAMLISFQFLPFAYLIYFPAKVYLGKWDFWQIITGISIQAVWIFVISMLVFVAWKRGLRRYSGEGI